MSHRKPGYRWRVLAHHDNGAMISIEYEPPGRVCFDELVIDDWLHIEQLGDREWMVILGDHMLNVRVPARGEPVVTGWLDEP